MCCFFISLGFTVCFCTKKEHYRQEQRYNGIKLPCLWLDMG
jgi:hypothetical protein